MNKRISTEGTNHAVLLLGFSPSRSRLMATVTYSDTRPINIALACAARGWRVFPVGAGADGKRPFVRWTTEATSDGDRIRAWFERAFPTAYVGVPTGTANRLYVIDEDEAGAVRGLGLQSDVPFVHTIRGRHYLFGPPEDGMPVPCSAGRLAKHVDLRGDGGYIRLLHMPPAGELPTLPARIAELARKTRREGPLREWYTGPPRHAWGELQLQAACRRIADAGHGARNSTLFRSSCEAWRLVNGGHVDETTATTALVESARLTGLDEFEIARTLISAREATNAEASGPRSGRRVRTELWTGRAS